MGRILLLSPVLLLLVASNIAAFTIDERIDAQRAIERVYYNHRIWPKENPGPKPPLEAILPEESLRSKVEDHLQKSNALAEVWLQPITPAQLQAEMDRMARETKQPSVLRELFAALNNDPQLIAECLARPILADRLIHNWYASDSRFHGDLKQQAESELQQFPTARLMRNLSGQYTETEWVLGQNNDARADSFDPSVITLNPDEWKQWTGDLRARFAAAQITEGVLSTLKEDADGFSVTTVLEKQPGRIRVAVVRWQKQPFDSWWSERKASLPADIAADPAIYTAPAITASSCADDTWAGIRSSPPSGRAWHTAVWTGSEMLVWGGSDGTRQLTGGRYDPSTDTWTATSTVNAPTARFYHTAVWTGSQMIVWGGLDDSNNPLNTGGRYNPSADTWTYTSTVNAPTARFYHTAVWTGSHMIVWGGSSDSSLLNTGGRYDPSSDTWSATSTANAPTARYYHTAVWTGSHMIVWGGSVGTRLLTGGRYDPSTDTWTATSTANAPEARYSHTAVWTASQMVVWGGSGDGGFLNTGGRYDPSTDTWTATSTANAPEARDSHTAVWTGSEMIVWAGYVWSLLNTGGRYDPSTDTWTAISTVGAPPAVWAHTAVWTGSQMIVWGGRYYEPDLENTGGRYDPSTDTWTATSTSNAPAARAYHTAVWTGSQMIVWGGYGNSGHLNTGGRYDPSSDTWTATSTTVAPAARVNPTAVWTGSHMIVWGGLDYGGYFDTGGRYDPSTDTWTTTSTSNAPAARAYHTVVWTGSHMIVWGGAWYNVGYHCENTGGRYDPSTDTWTTTSTASAPAARRSHTAVWTGSHMIVWGGLDNSVNPLNTGGRYNPSSDTWTDPSTIFAPIARAFHTAVWTGSQMIIWGGWNDGSYNHYLDIGGRYCADVFPLADDQSVSTSEDTSIDITLTASDPDEDPLTYAIVDAPIHGALSGTAPNVTYSPDSNYNGPDSFTFKANDGIADSNTATISITVSPVNDAPVANGQSVNTNEDTPVNITLTGSDVDGDALAFIVVSIPLHGTLSGTAPNLTYTPNANYNGVDSFTFKANDGIADSNIATVTLNVLPVNDPPVADNKSVSTGEDTAVAVVLAATDVDGDSLTFLVVSFPLHGSLSGSPPTLTYTPNTGYTGADSFTFKANDGIADSNTATVSIAVNAVNHAPDAVDDTADTLQDTATTIHVLANDSDPDGDTLIVISVTQGANGDVVNNDDGTVTYTPNTGFFGADSFTYTISDGRGGTDSATVNATVTRACLFCDDFEDGVMDWSYLKPAWSETDGSLVATPKRKAIALADTVFAGCQVCSVEAEMQTAGGIGNKMWLLGWYQDKNNTMELLIKEENDKIILRQRAGGRIVKKVAAAHITINPNISYRFKVAFDGTQFDVSMDGNHLITLTPVGIVPTGTVGFAVKNTIGTFGSIKVQ